MDPYPFISGGGVAVEGVLTRQEPAFSSSTGKATRRDERFPARRGQANDGEISSLAPSCEHPFAAR